MLVTKVHITYAHFPGKYTEKEVQTYLMKCWPSIIPSVLCVYVFSFENLQRFFSLFKSFNWRIIALQYIVSFCHTKTWISYTYGTSLLNLPPISYPIPSFCVVTEHQIWALCIIHWLSILGGNVYVSGEGNGNPLQYSCRKNPVDGGAWEAAIHGGCKEPDRLSDFTFTHWRRQWQPTPVFLPGESQRRQSLVGCRLWGHTESDTTEAT